MTWYHGLERIVRENEPLARYTWLGVGGSARYFCIPTQVEQIQEIVHRCRAHECPWKVLGDGANVLVRDEGFSGVVIHLDPKRFGNVIFDGETVRVGSALDLPDLVRRTVSAGLSGLEGLAGIPGTVGGALCMNAGGKFGEIGRSVTNVTLVDELGDLQTWGKERLQFGYRHSNLKGCIVVESVFRLARKLADEVSGRYREVWEFKKQTQPSAENTAGCMFKNPVGHSAGALIDRAGLKGFTCGGASVSAQHANFLVAARNATASDILNLAHHVQQQVLERFDVRLEFEVDVW